LIDVKYAKKDGVFPSMPGKYRGRAGASIVLRSVNLGEQSQGDSIAIILVNDS